MIATYSNEEFDALQDIADKLTAEDRAAGRSAPAYGYSKANAEIARRCVAVAGVTRQSALEAARRIRDEETTMQTSAQKPACLSG